MAMKCLPESQHHRTAEAGRHFWRLSCPIPLLKLGSPTSGFSGLCPTKFWTSLRMESLRETCSSVRPPSKWERFLYLNKISLISFFFPLCLLSFHWTPLSLAPYSAHTAISCLYPLMRFPLSLLFSRLNFLIRQSGLLFFGQEIMSKWAY